MYYIDHRTLDTRTPTFVARIRGIREYLREALTLSDAERPGGTYVVHPKSTPSPPHLNWKDGG